ncbi:MAG: type IV pili twitching motility protein PilT, partial [Gemmatimonadaceae bacterium]
FELNFKTLNSGRRAPTPLANAAVRPSAAFAPVMAGVGTGSRPSMPGLGANPLGTGPTLPPILTSPSGHSAVTSPNPLGDDTVFGSGFESLFGN